MKVKVVRFSEISNIAHNILTKYGKTPEDGVHYPALHSATYYTKTPALKLTWAFDTKSSAEQQKSMVENMIRDNVHVEVKTKHTEDNHYLIVKFNDKFDDSKISSWLGVKGTKCYFANQDVYRYYL